MHLFWLYLSTMPIGYVVVERFYPPSFPWAHVPGFLVAIFLWPLVVLLVIYDMTK